MLRIMSCLQRIVSVHGPCARKSYLAVATACCQPGPCQIAAWHRVLIHSPASVEQLVSSYEAK